MGDYTFHLGDMDEQARQSAASAAKNVSMKEGAGQILAAPMLKARDKIDEQLSADAQIEGLTFGDLPTGHEVKTYYDEHMRKTRTALMKLRDVYQSFADHFIATELYFRNTDAQIAEMFRKEDPGTVIKY